MIVKIVDSSDFDLKFEIKLTGSIAKPYDDVQENNFTTVKSLLYNLAVSFLFLIFSLPVLWQYLFH